MCMCIPCSPDQWAPYPLFLQCPPGYLSIRKSWGTPVGLWEYGVEWNDKCDVMPWKFRIWHQHWSFSKLDRQVLLQLFRVCRVPSHPTTLEWALRSNLVTATIKTYGLCLQTNIDHFGDTLRLPLNLSRKRWNIFWLISSWLKQSIHSLNCITST